MTGTLAPSVTATAQRSAQVLAEVEQVIVGKHEAVSQVLLCILASGHLLIEDLPGLGKTLLARTFAATLGLEFTRVQFTPDMLPSDLTGAPVLDPRTGEVVFRPGPPAAAAFHRARDRQPDRVRGHLPAPRGAA
jgi:MoxR-like ATPase